MVYTDKAGANLTLAKEKINSPSWRKASVPGRPAWHRVFQLTLRLGQLSENVVEDAAVAVVLEFLRGIDPDDHLEALG